MYRSLGLPVLQVADPNQISNQFVFLAGTIFFRGEVFSVENGKLIIAGQPNHFPKLPSVGKEVIQPLQ